MTMFNGLYKIRDYRGDDKSFVLATFLRGLYYGDSWFKLIPKQIFMQNYKIIAEKILSSLKVRIRVACLPDEPDVILGYSILSADETLVHWVYVKSAWRLKGIGKSLMPDSPEATTHLSELGNRLLEEKYKEMIFNPFLINYL